MFLAGDNLCPLNMLRYLPTSPSPSSSKLVAGSECSDLSAVDILPDFGEHLGEGIGGVGDGEDEDFASIFISGDL